MISSKTMMKRLEQYRDRWSSHGLNTGILEISEMLSPAELRQYEIFQEFSDAFLERISPDVSVAHWKKGALLFEEGSYIDLAFFIVGGSVEVSLEAQAGDHARAAPIFESGSMAIPQITGEADGTMILDMVNLSKMVASNAKQKEITFLATLKVNLAKQTTVKLKPGEFFGEIGSLTGWPQAVTARVAQECELIQIRLPALRMMKTKSQALKDQLDRLYRDKVLFSQLKSTPLFRNCDDSFLERLKEKVDLVSLEPGQVFLSEGEPVEALFLVRSGFIKLVQRFGEGELAVSYLSKGKTLGELELLNRGLATWETTAIAVEYAELIEIPRTVLDEVLRQDPTIEDHLWRSASQRVKDIGNSKRNLSHSAFTQTALDRGLVQGTSILGIDLDVCTRCDDCVRACAATHSNRPRFVREGQRLANLLLPKSCYHCRDPVCLVGCPTGAIHRAGIKEVVEIDGDICIGCSTCANNCPYDAIVMHDMQQTWAADMVPTGLRGKQRVQASKCDMCYDKGHEPACVTNCPQGCATRIGVIENFEKLMTQEHHAPKSEGGARKQRTATAWRLGFTTIALLCLAMFMVEKFVLRAGPASWWRIGYGIAATAFLVLVSLYAVRRRAMRIASKFHLGSARNWLYLHIYGGLLFMLLVLMHSDFHWPMGTLNQGLWALSMWTVMSGLAGLGLQKWIPKVLSSGLTIEALFERIPELIGELRNEASVLAETGSESLKSFYHKSLAPFMDQPQPRWAYFIDITGGVQNALKDFNYLRSILSQADKQSLDEMERILRAKLELDAQFTLQRALRWWMYLHVPPALLLVLLVGLHIFTSLYY